MLNGKDVPAVRVWVEAADRWAQGAQELVAAAAGLAVVSRDIATNLEQQRNGEAGTMKELRVLADELERDTAFLRDRYLATAADLDQYRDVLD